MILFLHNRYRTTGGEERVVGDLVTLVREELGEDAELLERDSAALGRARAAAGLLGGGLQPGDVAAAVRRSRARVVHAHNLLPAFGWRALAAAREAGARVVLHLHNYRLVCAVGTCFTRGADCTRCHGRDTRPGVRLNCRGTGAEAAVYAAALALWQRRLVAQADHVIVPSAFAAARLRELGAPLGEVAPLGSGQGHAGARSGLGPLGGAHGHAGARAGLGPLGAAVHVVPHPVAPVAHAPCFDPAGPALFAGRLAPEKGADVAIDACRIAGRALVVAGDGPLRAHLEARAAGADVRFLGAVDPARLAQLRAGARSRSCRRARPRPSAWPPPRRWPPACPWSPRHRRAARAARRRPARPARRRAGAGGRCARALQPRRRGAASTASARSPPPIASPPPCARSTTPDPYRASSSSTSDRGTRRSTRAAWRA
ncbi:MAG: glycosyltransferase [Solirubrobacteraceae bacterium]